MTIALQECMVARPGFGQAESWASDHVGRDHALLLANTSLHTHSHAPLMLPQLSIHCAKSCACRSVLVGLLRRTVNPLRAGFTEQQAASIMNNSPEVWSHYDRDKTYREQQQVVTLFPLLVEQLVAYHKNRPAASTAAAAAAVAEEKGGDHSCDSYTASSCGEDSSDAADRQHENLSVLPNLRQWAQQQQEQQHEKHERQRQGQRPSAGTLTLGLML